MKTFTLVLSLLFLSLGFVQVTTGAPTFTGGDCGCKDSDNKLKNGGFESGTANWTFTGDGSFGTDTKYSTCGSNKNGLMNGSGLVYQEVNIAGGSKVNFSVYGGTHETDFRHRIFLTFYNGNTLIPVTENDHNMVSMNYKVTHEHKLQEYSLWENAPANANKVRVSFSSNGNYFKIDAACMSVDPPAPVAECCKDEDNAIKNGSFEDGTKYWEKGATNFGTDEAFNMCGSKNGLITGSGSVYQDVALVGGSKVSIIAYGGTHDTKIEHSFKMEFYDGDTKVASITPVPMDYKVTDSNLKKFTISGDAPLNATKVRFILYSAGDFFKVDVVCMTITPPPTTPCSGCADAETVLKNPSFENGTNDWAKLDGTSFSTLTKSYACGTKVGKIAGAGTVYQEYSVVPGTAVNLTISGATENPAKNNKFLLLFYNSSNELIPGAHNISRDVEKNSASGLQQYTLPSTAPAGTVKVIVAASSDGSNFYFDAACMSIVPPSQCETCTNNRLANAGFETGTSSWTSEGNVSSSPDAKNCGDNGLKLIGSGKFYQNIAFQSAWGSSVSLTIWGAKEDNGGQKFHIFFYDDSNKELGKIEKDVSKIFGTAPTGLEKYVLAGAIPAGTKVIRIQGSATSGVFRADQGCLTFSGSPLPVTLAAFDVKKEGSTASLNWSTTYETNSDHFDIQHSQDGKIWNALTTIQAQGESKGLITYHYTHTSPLAVNLYRLKMVDADGTFAYSSIRSLNFNGDLEVAIYPNPTSDRIKFSGNQAIENVKIYNVSGIMVLNALPNASNEVDLTKLTQGTYFVKVNNNPVLRKVVVVK
ncbi:T9SS type A sorting domain-containing protein [Dyadobacter sp. CY323]|uniref:T9SS type A sorting domain-containing protein n=1 Tax=Dyadobacter sp. CY323 TaxID=2907302 RepID=UPI001F48F1C4|nr:T9SS type A sorting domain-containing protein [Dyadobacter sp. CY323]MCE6992413.1 T9SS type A sorting domain-containing protein [Dyadobacter sp. CY323]